MRVKKHQNGNEYLFQDGLWIRNFTKAVHPIDLNQLTEKTDYQLIVDNEIKNNSLNISEIDTDKISHTKAVIISDGYDFTNKQQLLLSLPKDVLIIATNRSLVKWKINKTIDYFVVNNPYQECMLQMPKHRYLPSCIASTRTYHPFVKEYDSRDGVVFRYTSVRDGKFSPSVSNTICQIDDYRNPICAAIVFAYKIRVSQLLLFCCDNAMEQERPGTEQITNGKWLYPQQKTSHLLIDGLAYWYKKSIKDHSSGLEYKNIPYISEDEITDFFAKPAILNKGV